VDLSAAYDLVSHTGLFLKLSKVLPHWLVESIILLLSNGQFRVHMGNKCSSWRHRKNGLPQRSVLFPCLFNFYMTYLQPVFANLSILTFGWWGGYLLPDSVCRAYAKKK